MPSIEKIISSVVLLLLLFEIYAMCIRGHRFVRLFVKILAVVKAVGAFVIVRLCFHSACQQGRCESNEAVG